MRILVGGTFLFSGFVKAIDPWGLVIKIGEYLAVWGLDVPGPLVTFAAFVLCAFEFVWGGMLLVGCYRRFSVWCVALMMAFMLPLTAYIAIANPVDDCGCFGDFLVISNTATLVKNIFLTAGIVYLWAYNARVSSLFINYIHWIIGGLFTFFILIIELIGYNVQPMADFRRFAPGTMLLQTDEADDEEEDTDINYVYEKDGQRRTFTMYNLPDSTWTFVSRELVGGSDDTSDGFVVIEDGEDITSEIINPDIEQFVVTIPDLSKADLSSTYLVNELNDFITARGGNLVALIGSDEEGIEWWKDISMASYPILKAEPKLLKELARGNAALTYLDHGRVEWKRSLSSISYTLVTEIPSSKLIQALNPESGYWLRTLCLGFVILLAAILILDHSGKLLAWYIKRRKQFKKLLNSGSKQ